MKFNKQEKRNTLTKEVSEVNLPSDYAWKILDNLVEDLKHLLTSDEVVQIKGIIRNRDYASYLEHGGTCGTQGKYLHDKPLASMRAVYQVYSLLKKYNFPGDALIKRQAATKKFFEAEGACEAYNHSGYLKLSWAKEDWEVDVFTYARQFLVKVLGFNVPSFEKLTHWSRHGPGANLDTQYGQVDAYHKHQNWPYSCTSDAFGYARVAIQNDQRWLGALEDDYRARNNIPKHSILDQRVFWTSVLKIVPGNRITFVPKDARTERTIAIEPSMNLYLQLGVDGYIRRRLKRWDIDIDDQTKNQTMARLGSVDQDNPELRFVTLDLSSASDSISTMLCKKLLTPEWYSYLMKLRSPVGVLDNETISYEKISSMGNGFTFALETAIFASIVYGVQMAVEGRYSSKQCSIYGDDIIVTDRIADLVICSLSNAGFTINREKSFLSGPFRESCGADWFHGKPVRPVFLKEKPVSVFGLYTDVNRLKRTLLLRFSLESSNTESLIDKWIPEKFRKFIGPFSDEDFDSYKHSDQPKKGWYKGFIYRYRRVIVTPLPRRAKSFLLRKLMHPLRQCPPSRSRWDDTQWRGGRLTSSGSAFTVTDRKSVKVRLAHSHTSSWCDVYSDA